MKRIAIYEQTCTRFELNNMKKRKILIVDDNITSKIFFSGIINCMGNEYIYVENGEKALEVLNNNDIDMIFMDIEMPVMNGFETTNHIRNKTDSSKSNIPIIALTIHNSVEYMEKIKVAGFNELITKPYSAKNIIHIINKYSTGKYY